jgi:hypothetical protein
MLLEGAFAGSESRMSDMYLVPGHISIPTGPLGVVLLILVVMSVGILAAVVVWGVLRQGPPDE